MPQHFVSLSVFICVATCFKPINLMQHCNLVCSSKIHLIWINILLPGGCRRPFCSKLVTLFSFVGDTDGTRSFQWQHQQQWESTLPFFYYGQFAFVCDGILKSSNDCLFFRRISDMGKELCPLKKLWCLCWMVLMLTRPFFRNGMAMLIAAVIKVGHLGTWVRFNLLRWVVWEQWTMLSCTVGHWW